MEVGSFIKIIFKITWRKIWWIGVSVWSPYKLTCFCFQLFIEIDFPSPTTGCHRFFCGELSSEAAMKVRKKKLFFLHTMNVASPLNLMQRKPPAPMWPSPPLTHTHPYSETAQFVQMEQQILVGSAYLIHQSGIFPTVMFCLFLANLQSGVLFCEQIKGRVALETILQKNCFLRGSKSVNTPFFLMRLLICAFKKIQNRKNQRGGMLG